jgi:hypothetical protein
MNFDAYHALFKEILDSKNPVAPYDKSDYLNYVKLNLSRSNRWLKTAQILSEIKEKIVSIKEEQNWILITEPWCGDASHSVPFIFLLSELSHKIKLEIQLRDSNSEIEKYLTNGGKSIPILVIRDKNLKDLAVWGPRPKVCQALYLKFGFLNKTSSTIP